MRVSMRILYLPNLLATFHRWIEFSSQVISVVALDISITWKDTLPETNSLPLKMDGWKTILSFRDGNVSGAMLNFRWVPFWEHLHQLFVSLYVACDFYHSANRKLVSAHPAIIIPKILWKMLIAGYAPPKNKDIMVSSNLVCLRTSWRKSGILFKHRYWVDRWDFSNLKMFYPATDKKNDSGFTRLIQWYQQPLQAFWGEPLLRNHHSICPNYNISPMDFPEIRDPISLPQLPFGGPGRVRSLQFGMVGCFPRMLDFKLVTTKIMIRLRDTKPNWPTSHGDCCY